MAQVTTECVYGHRHTFDPEAPNAPALTPRGRISTADCPTCQEQQLREHARWRQKVTFDYALRFGVPLEGSPGAILAAEKIRFELISSFEMACGELLDRARVTRQWVKNPRLYRTYEDWLREVNNWLQSESDALWWISHQNITGLELAVSVTEQVKQQGRVYRQELDIVPSYPPGMVIRIGNHRFAVQPWNDHAQCSPFESVYDGYSRQEWITGTQPSAIVIEYHHWVGWAGGAIVFGRHDLPDKARFSGSRWGWTTRTNYYPRPYHLGLGIWTTPNAVSFGKFNSVGPAESIWAD